MAKIEMVIYKWKKLKDGTNPIMLRISKEKSRKLLSTGISSLPKQWNDEYGLFVKDKRLTKDYDLKNEALNKIKAKALDIVRDFERQGVDWTLNQFEAKMRSKAYSANLKCYFESHIEKLKNNGKFGYAEVFSSTLLILTLFDPKFAKLKFPDIDQNYIQRFDSFLRLKRELKDTSISVYMRTLATLLNAAIKDGIMDQNTYPFGRNGYKISKLNIKTRKRYVPVEHLQKLKNYKFDNLRLEIARNLFMLSFYCRGINWIDMAMLKKENIQTELSKDGKQVKVIRFTRAKTKTVFEILINEDIQDLLNWFEDSFQAGKYLLPIITRPQYKGEELRKHIANRRGKYNKALNEIAKIEELKFPESLQKISSYFSRHSYAMALRTKGVGVEIISEALGHAELKTTNIYLDSFGCDAVAAASEGLL
ncbi:MAG: site-specific integrase [Bacteroidetes bacterium]|jgi:integrase|nr:site-specific integrase [Bacteroidota bacterium]